MSLNLSQNAMTVLERRYLAKDVNGKILETPEDMFRRVAKNVASAGKLYGETEEEIARTEEEFYELMANLEFLPNSPTLMNAGRELQQLSACFVLPIEDSMESIFEAIKNTALIHKSGGGTGFSFSRLRPKNDKVLSTGGVASGPISFMKVFNAATEAVKQGGTRRGANMGILRVDHPDILEFITAKRDTTELTNFNISVALTEEFMEAVEAGSDYELINPRTKQSSGKLNAKEVFDLIVEMAWQNGEPGIVFLDRINRDNPVPELGEIESTNPCGEQPLLPYESCNLGSINLSKMVSQDGGAPKIDYKKLSRTVQIAVKFLDNVIDVNEYPLPEIEERTKRTRKIGLGVMGFADMLIKLGIPYNSEKGVKTGEEVMKFIREEAKKTSQEIAKRRGTFPAWEKSVYATEGIPMRNATVTTVAPTGTLSIIANCSSGIEPIFALCYVRNILDDDKLIEVNPLFDEIAKSEEFYHKDLMERIAATGSLKGIEEVPVKFRKLFVTALDISPEWHIKMQAAFQKYTDNAVSKTVNFPQEATKEDVRKVFMLAYKEGCKGVTIYRYGSREKQVLSLSKPSESKAVGVGEIVPRQRPDIIQGKTVKIRTGCGNLYVTINEDEVGLFEVFAHLGKTGGCAAAQTEAVSRLISLALRSGVKVESILENLRGIRCPSPSWQNGGMILSCPDAIGIALQRYLGVETTGKTPILANLPEEVLNNPSRKGSGILMGACPECGGAVEYIEGCLVCRLCGYSKCS